VQRVFRGLSGCWPRPFPARSISPGSC